MSTTVYLGGFPYQIPTQGEIGWATNVTNFLSAIGSNSPTTNGNVLTKLGGTFTLENPVSFGNGVIASSFSSDLLQMSTSGIVKWGTLPLYVSGGQLYFNGSPVSAGAAATPLTTKGDIYTYSTIPDRLPVGTNGYVLSADSTAATGLRWVPMGSGGGGGSGTVTSVTVNGTSGRIASSGSPITSSGTITMDLVTTGVTPGSYTNSNVTVDAYGRITSISNGSGGGGGSGTVTSVAVTSSNLTVTGSPITTSGTITVNMPNSGVTAGSYTNANITVDAQGRITAASTGTGSSITGFTGASNTAIGQFSFTSLTSGTANTGIGNAAGYKTTSGSDNTALGLNALFWNTIGNKNTAVGSSSLQSLTTGSYNIAVGSSAGVGNTTGSNNVAIGDAALYTNTVSNYNVAVGNTSLLNATGYNNTAIGYGAGTSVTNYNYTTCLGYNAQVTGSQQAQIGDSGTTTYVYGTVQNRSDLRDKADVTDTALGLNFITKLRPVDYLWDMRDDYKTPMPIRGDKPNDEFEQEMAQWLEANKLENIVRDGSKKRSRKHHGFIAQEVKVVMDELDVEFGGYQDHSIKGGDQVLSIGYDELIAPMVKAIQELKAEIESLKSQLNK